VWNWLGWAYRHTIVYSQEIVLGWAWVAFSFFGENAPLISTLQVQYPPLASMFEIAFLVAGALLLVAIAKPKLLFSAFVFSSFVSIGALAGAIGVEVANASILYPMTWTLFAFVSITQAIRHFHDWDGVDGA
jgi:hypothetical protein